jgi:hypothetical protein
MKTLHPPCGGSLCGTPSLLAAAPQAAKLRISDGENGMGRRKIAPPVQKTLIPFPCCDKEKNPFGTFLTQKVRNSLGMLGK